MSKDVLETPKQQERKNGIALYYTINAMKINQN